MLGDWHAHLVGCGGVFDKEKKKIALDSLYKNNFKESMRYVTNMWRNFALNDEGGVLICTYPQGAETPAIPIPYCEECMTGFEYALAGLMLAEGEEQRAQAIVSAIRARYDGEKRNPWSEIECGSNYARSMASFALMLHYSGFSYDMTKKYIGFDPINGGGAYLWSVGNTYGKVEISDTECTISILGEPLELECLKVGGLGTVEAVYVDGKAAEYLVNNDAVCGKWTVSQEIKIEYKN